MYQYHITKNINPKSKIRVPCLHSQHVHQPLVPSHGALGFDPSRAGHACVAQCDLPPLHLCGSGGMHGHAKGLQSPSQGLEHVVGSAMVFVVMVRLRIVPMCEGKKKKLRSYEQAPGLMNFLGRNVSAQRQLNLPED